jgi:ABC-type molybdenum transport system ATPase subunit/photorepair protein PhrA
MVKTPFKIKTVSMESTIDAITTQVINDIIASAAFKTNDFEPDQDTVTQDTVTQDTEQEEATKKAGRPKKTMSKQ